MCLELSRGMRERNASLSAGLLFLAEGVGQPNPNPKRMNTTVRKVLRKTLLLPCTRLGWVLLKVDS